MEILEDLQSFLKVKERRTSPKTLAMYRSYVNRFTKYLVDNRVDMIAPKHLEGFIGQWTNVNTQAGYKRFLKMFFRYVGRQDLLNYIRDNMKDIKGEGQFKVDLTLLEVLRLIDATERTEYKFAWACAAFEGFRAGTILGLYFEDIDVTNKLITLQQREGEPYGPKGMAPNDDPVYKPMSDITITLFTQIPRGTGRIIPCSYKTLRKWFNRYVEQAGITKHNFPLTIHKLRHFFGHQWVQNQGNIRVLKEIMGHSSMDYTMLYTAPSDATLKEEFHKVMELATRIKGPK